jgi:hypothetical protein
MNRKGTFLIGSLGAIAALTPMLMPARASAQTAATVAFSGVSNDTIDWVGGTGTFSFSTSAPLGCADVGVVNGVLSAAACTITASGWFTNIVFGTGTAGGTATMAAAGGLITFGFQSIWVAGQCIILPNPLGAPPSVVGVNQLVANNLEAPNPSAPNDGVATNGVTLTGALELLNP